jgi:hypothetical protein
VVIAAFTSSWARLKLWSVLQMLGQRVFYTDTDSVVFQSIPNEPDPPLGDYLGDLADELTCKRVGCSGCPSGSHSLAEFVACGAKNYAYVTDNDHHVCKVRGFTLNSLAALQLNFNTMKSNLIQWYHQHCQNQDASNNPETLSTNSEEQIDTRVVITSSLIARDKQNATVYNRIVSKLYGIVLDKHRITDGFNTQPFGYIS